MQYLTNFKIMRLLKSITIFFCFSNLSTRSKSIITKRLLKIILLLKLILLILLLKR